MLSLVDYKLVKEVFILEARWTERRWVNAETPPSRTCFGELICLITLRHTQINSVQPRSFTRQSK